MMMNTVLHYALAQVPLPPGGDVLWLMDNPLHLPGDTYTPFAGQHAQLNARKCKAYASLEELRQRYSAVVLFCPKQIAETEALLALALQKSAGLVMVIAPNDAGGYRLSKLMQGFGVNASSLAKSNCKIVWTMEAPSASPTKIKQTLQALALQELMFEERTWWTMPGLFGWDKVDEGSALLAKHFEPHYRGRAADFGCGYGYLSVHLEKSVPELASIDAYDVDARTVAATQRNTGEKVKAIWADITTLQTPATYDLIVMNPPFHLGKEQELTLGKACIMKAWESLHPRGTLLMVANRQLPYEELIPGMKRVQESERFKILKVSK